MKDLNPYQLGKDNLATLSLPDLLRKTAVDDTVNICFVFGTGQYEDGVQIGYSIDALYVPEVIQALCEVTRMAGLGLRTESRLDIDVLADPQIHEEFNLVLLGSGRNNGLTYQLLAHYGSSLAVRFTAPNNNDIVSAVTRNAPPRKYLLGVEGKYCGLLTMVANPWAKEAGFQKFIIVAAGILGIGTAGATYLLTSILLDHIDNMEQPKMTFANSENASVPARVLEVTKREYPAEISDFLHSEALLHNVDTAAKRPVLVLQ